MWEARLGVRLDSTVAAGAGVVAITPNAMDHEKHVGDTLFFFSSRRRHTRLQGDWSSDVCSSDLHPGTARPNCFHRASSPCFLAVPRHKGPRNRRDIFAEARLYRRSMETTPTIGSEIGRASCRERV